MTRDDIISMAKEAGFDPHDMSDDFTCNLMDIERFAVLVISSHQPQSSMSWQEGYEIGVATEREACAKVCENGTFLHDFSPEAVYSRACARGIRARGQV
jgi:hypothetical protein